MSMHSTLFTTTICAAAAGVHTTVSATSMATNPIPALLKVKALVFMKLSFAASQIFQRCSSWNLPHRIERAVKWVIADVHPTLKRLVEIGNRQHDQCD